MAADRLEKAQSALTSDGLVIENRFGALVPHPAAAIAKEASATINASLRQLALPDPVEEPTAGIKSRPGPRKRVW